MQTEDNLKDFLDRLYTTFDVRLLSPDPLQLVRDFDDPHDREIAGFLGSSLAYGRVERILFSVERVLSAMDGEPYAFVTHFDPVEDATRFEGFVHRFNRGRDVACLLFFLQQAIDQYGSLEAMFMDGYCEEDKDVGRALARFVDRFLGCDCSPFYRDGILPPDAGVRFFLPSPVDGSACKRLNLFLRWMVRCGSDGLDLGVWRSIAPSKLVMPVDTHVARIARNMGLTERKQADWRMAIELTERFRVFDAEDPVKYDFALCHWGMLEARGQRPEARSQKQEKTLLVSGFWGGD
ncbi:MAG: TIGR02757 family protein [Candidatus Latescibacteria bacterium]|nr:TIGR02757 family protein [Candidatus Latescibacterota bacterium]